MKSVFACISLSLLSASVFAAEPAAADGKPCVVPVIPAVSTQLVDYLRVVHDVKAWNACVLGQQSEENLRLHQEVKVQAMAWLAATAKYSKENAPAEKTPAQIAAAERRSNAEFDRTFDKIDARLTSLDHERQEAAQRFNMERQVIIPGQTNELRLR